MELREKNCNGLRAICSIVLRFLGVENICSSPETITCGVPQGSILGPLLFITFFNDLAENGKCNVIQYADDTVIYFASSDVDIIEKTLNFEMKAISEYCFVNELLLNLKKGKTECTLFGTAKRLRIHGKELKVFYNSFPISFVKEYIYLGNVIDNNFNLNSNFEHSYKRASNCLTQWNNVRKYLTVKAATDIFHFMILPILPYTGTTKLTLTKTQTQRLQSFMNRAKRITKNHNLNDVYTTIQRQNCMLVRKCLEKKTNSEIYNGYFEVIKHLKNTRNDKYLLRLPSVKLETAKQGFYFGGAKLYNSLPLEIRMKDDISEFHSCLKDFKEF